MQSDNVSIGTPSGATIYQKRGKSYISEEGFELEILDLQLSNGAQLAKVVHRGIHRCVVIHQPTNSVYEGGSPLWLISNNVSRFATQIEELSHSLATQEHLPKLYKMLEGVSDGFLAASKEISRLSSKLIDVILKARSNGTIVVEPEGPNEELIKETKRANDFEKLLKYQLAPESKLPIAYYACMEGVRPLVMESLLKNLPDGALEEMIELRGDELKKVGLPVFAPPYDFWALAPIHVAALHGHIELKGFLMQARPSCASLKLKVGDTSFSLLEVSAFSSRGITQLAEDISAVSLPRVVKMALLGGNIDLLPFVLSSQDLATFNGLVRDHWHVTAVNGSFLNCLKWMTANLKEFQGPDGKTNFLALRDQSGASVLHLAAKHGDVKLLNWLQHEFTPNWSSLDLEEKQPLHYASNSLSSVKWLYDRAKITDLTIETRDNFNLAHLAVLEPNFEVLNFIFSILGSTCLHGTEEHGFPPIECCIGEKSARLLSWLQEKEYDFARADHRGNTFSHRLAWKASTKEHLDLLTWLKDLKVLTLQRRNKKQLTVLQILEKRPLKRLDFISWKLKMGYK